MARALKRKTVITIPRNERFITIALGGLFLTIGAVVPGGLMVKSIRGYLRTSDEVSVEARILKLERSRGRRASTIAEYSYRYHGEGYRSTNVALFRDSSDLYQNLKTAHESGTTVRAWIDPDHPSYAVIDREWKWSKIPLAMILFGGFAGVGCHLIYCGWRGHR
ncbi:DUF3592 domain-containing protein [Luteolibacter arcticus]|uniref:DUF3592 domain-containing protein n=1 Tax=Luteolibacter arcticus TaxID=1581411 RepID=A0ABT3GI51_9BACT|nr:DUF3592 domain-containing protein [Luteolibacter arcticus]MCW1923174.1 DUF3592 domain-containing protein [Luteolibacter arcticus]